MRRARVRTLRWVLALACIGGALSAVRAAQQIAGNEVIMPQERAVNEDLYVAGQTVQIAAPVRGDVVAAGRDVTLSGDVQGYLMAAGSTVTVSNRVGNDLWAAGANVTVSGLVGDNANLAGATVTLQPAASVGGDASLAGGTVVVRGRINHNLRLAASNARLASEVQGTVRAHVERLSLDPGAQVQGDLVVYGPHAPIISPQAKVLGRVEYHPEQGRQTRHGLSLGGLLGWWLFRFLAMLLLGSLMLALSPLWVERVSETIVRQPGLSALIGAVGLVVVPLICLPLIITVIGIPLAILLGALYVAVLLLASVFVAYLTGGIILRRWGSGQATPLARLAWGALVLSASMALPWIGGLVRLITLITGFGALVLERRDLLQRLRAAGLA